MKKCGRDVLKSNWKDLEVEIPDRKKGILIPPYIKPFDENGEFIDLTPIEKINLGNVDLNSVLENRKSRRNFADTPLTLEELSYLLYYTQGVKNVIKDKVTFRTVPSAGATHPLETYLLIFNVDGVDEGLYRYIPTIHKLLLIKNGNFSEEIIRATLGQTFIGKSAVVFVWTAIPYRTEWKYSFEAHKTIAIDAGHVCQNLYLTVESINCGTCAVAAYDQELMDKLIEVDGNNEFVVYLAPVGKI
ncbi:SagB-type dehydrogenase domain-containing protein [Marinitoga hydrogenitolerans DSM 16785]|uniref:SagB-type dehydrogenase domain-containing protein n=1 Tax=Marinitoga hydrogenitolerans (strain DSM 16785 / JCM 12826 / AT1271) TaxID=1122195 RepID=A0A1M4YLY2_MARH1|nr:SagB/ThcOx family dehydrogenase [Marinitoga hydrogenitolerans]SHF06825.1 SagB-type dehydrogenase domain-containing protein [Marinitoga hydrogenitolerans DSM 16785]